MNFLEAGNDYLSIQRSAPQTMQHNRWLLERLKSVHHEPVADLAAPKLLLALRKLEAKGQNATAHRACTFASAVLRYALAAGMRTAPDVAPGLKTILVAHKTRNQSAIVDPVKFGALLAAIEGLRAGPVRDALTVLPHVFVRPSELRGMTWAELDLAVGEWRIPAERMKMRQPFTKYLSRQVVDLLGLIRGRLAIERGTLAADGDNFVFSGRDSGCVSENAMGAALKSLFYSPEEMTPHGFRASASTMLHEIGHEHLVIEAALAHRAKDVAAAYNRATYADRQRELHQAWSDMVDEMRAGATR